MLRRIATVVAASSAIVLGGAGVAYAHDATVYTRDYWYGWVQGSATWTENGDTLTVCDSVADGYGVRGYIYTPYNNDHENGTVLIKVSDPSDDGNCAAVSKNLSETATIGIKVCEYRGAEITECDWQLIARG